MERVQGDFVLTDDLSRVDVETLHAWLQTSYLADGRPLDVVKRSGQNSICFSAHREGDPLAFARAVTDESTFAWIADVFVREDVRGQGVGKWLMSVVMEHPAVAGLQVMLRTRDAHGLYERFGFERVEALRKPREPDA